MTIRTAAAAAVALLACVCGSGQDAGLGTTPTPFVDVCEPNPSPARTGLAPLDFGYRSLDTPRPGDSVRSPLRVAGRANPFEGAHSVTVFDAAGRTIAARDFFKDNRVPDFAVEVPFVVTSPTEACVWVHERSGRDGSPVNITQVPVRLLP